MDEHVINSLHFSAVRTICIEEKSSFLKVFSCRYRSMEDFPDKQLLLRGIGRVPDSFVPVDGVDCGWEEWSLRVDFSRYSIS